MGSFWKSLFVIWILSSAHLAAGTITVFNGLDGNVGVGSPLPNSNAAAAEFQAAAALFGPVLSNGLETVPLGRFTTLNIDGVTTLSQSNTGPGSLITNDATRPSFGFNTTPGGANFYRFATQRIALNVSTTATATFDFGRPINAFGAYFTAVGGGGDTIQLQFNDGTAQFLTLPDLPHSAQFFGFTDTAPVSSLVVSMAYTNSASPNFAYFIGIDDVMTTTPEPDTWQMLALASLPALLLRRKFASRPLLGWSARKHCLHTDV